MPQHPGHQLQGLQRLCASWRTLSLGLQKGLSSLTRTPPKFRSRVAKMSCLVGRNWTLKNTGKMYWFPLLKAAPVTTHFAFALVFRGWWQPFTPLSAPVFWIAELILLAWGENSWHHCQCHSAVAGLFHSKTLPAPPLLPKYSQCPNQGLHQGLHLNAFMGFFSACQMLAQEKGIMHMADALPELPTGRVEELCRQHQTHHRTARGRSSLNPGTWAPLQKGSPAKLSARCLCTCLLTPQPSCCSVGPMKTIWFQGFGTTFQQEPRG